MDDEELMFYIHQIPEKQKKDIIDLLQTFLSEQICFPSVAEKDALFGQKA